MRCEEAMKKNVESIQKDDTVQNAAQKMRVANIGFLPVFDENGVVYGVVTDRDIALRVCATGKHPDETSVEEIATHDVISCRPEDDLHIAEDLMSRHQKSRIMVIDKANKLVGVISLSDVACCEKSAKRAMETLRQISDREVHYA